MQTGIPGEAA